MKISIGKRLSATVNSLQEAVLIYEKARDESFEGSSTFPDGKVVDGKDRYRISYNGRIWNSLSQAVDYTGISAV